MISNIQTTSVYVNDQGKAAEFYVNSMGFEKRSDQPMGDGTRWVEVAPPGAQTGIVLVKGFADWSPERVGKFTGLVVTTDDIEATYQEMQQRGVTFSEPPTPQPWGMKQALFEDLDGNGYVMVGR